ncbi:MAG TPA: amidohydrolase family protein, partial [Steroidobacteraceae bacterium]|nr:amidohydrolase family protein [Steroidobacteraceae bacterium]
DSGPGLGYFAELREKTREAHAQQPLPDRPATLEDLQLGTYLREIWFDSDTKIAALSGAPSDLRRDWLLPNRAIAETRDSINRFAGSRRLLSHFIFTPGQPGWLDEIDRGIEQLRPDAMKGYTVGDSTHKELSRYPWRMDDEQVAYRGYEKFSKAGIRNVAVHKGLYTRSDEQRFPRLKEFARVDDVGKAARDWPQLNFLIYHAAYRYTGEGEPSIALAEFERTGRMEWVSELAEIPARYGVSNVYADIGASFAACCVTEPHTAAAMLGILIRGMGADHVIWGTDSIWFGSPQWQIEALRRLEIPEAMRRRHGFAPLGAADGPIKTAIFGLNAARLQQLALTARWQRQDALEEHRLAYRTQGFQRSNRAYGYILAPASRATLS